MKLASYFDVVLVDSLDSYYGRLALLIRRIHQTGVAQSVQFALDFPLWMKNGTPGAKVRVFFCTKDQAESFKSGLDSAVNDDEVMTGSVKSVDESAIKGWVNVVRLREPKKIKLTDDPEKNAEMNNLYAMRIANSKRFPSLPVRSSSGHLMPILIDRLPADEVMTGEPSGYGLSGKMNRVRVPVL